MTYLNQLNQFDTAEISDAMDACGIEGALVKIKPITPGTKLIGEAFTVKYSAYESKTTEFHNAGNYIDEVPPNAVIVIDNNGREDCTTWGDILTEVAMLRNIAGTVVYGAVRDVAQISKSRYPLYSSAVYMRSGKNRVYKSDHGCDLLINGIKIKRGDIIMGDDNGVISIPKELIQEVIDKANNIQATEEAIIASIKTGMTLEQARKLHRYDQPWLAEDAKK